MNIFQQFADFWQSHGTKVLGSLGTILGSILTLKAQYPDLLNATTTTYLSAGATLIGIWTAKRGVYNTDQIAQKVTEKQSAAPQPPKPPGAS